MKYTKYILFLVALIFASCSIDDDLGKNNDNNKIRLVSRVVPFNQHDVDTRAYGDVAEGDITSLDYVILAQVGNDLKCIFYQHSENSIITIDKNLDFYNLTHNADGTDNTEGQALLQNCKIYVIANYPAIYDTIVSDATTAGETDIKAYIDNVIEYNGSNTGKTAGYFTAIRQSVPENLPLLGIPTTGLPRMGCYKDANGNSNVNIQGLEGGNTFEVRLESLYAKMVFDIKVDPNQEVVGQFGNTFELVGYTITNLANSVDINSVDLNSVAYTSSPEGTNTGSCSLNADNADDVNATAISGAPESIVRQSSRNVRFTCYLPERYLPATTAANSYTYPFLNGQPLRDEDKNLRQRYKPLLAPATATYVTLNGTFINHQGHSYDVSYKIYVGNDNYSNFDVVRNRQYNNYITIRGIDNANDQSTDTTNGVAIDHRVDIQRSSPVIVNLRRETLLDSHFEVRPMRIRRSDAQDDSWSGKTLAVKVEIIDADVTGATTKTKADWIGLERSYGAGPNTSDKSKYCDGDGALGASSAGKRKYFTTDLTTSESELARTAVNELIGTDGYSQKGGQMVIVPVTEAGECVWIYVDECDEDIANNEVRTEASTDLQAVRKATIRVTNGYLAENKSFLPLQEGVYDDYIINQHKLYKVTYEGHTYCIEHEEEYLYNFDSEDTYTDNQTEFEGMPWGLDGAQLSFDISSFVAESGDDFISNVIDWFKNRVIADNPPKYDFYIEKHDKMNGVTKASRAGYAFCDSIIYTINHSAGIRNTGYDGSIGVLSLDQTPTSALEYCYNRNKRDEDGDVVSLDWYMPAIDELEDIMMGAYSDFDVFQNKFYWSCQPAYYKCLMHYNGEFAGFRISEEGDFYVDNINNARATKVIYSNGNYGYAKSGGSGVFLVMHIKSSSDVDTYNLVEHLKSNNSLTYSYKTTTWWSSDNHTMTIGKDRLPTFEEGNFPRIEKHRVRAVRKMN